MSVRLQAVIALSKFFSQPPHLNCIKKVALAVNQRNADRSGRRHRHPSASPSGGFAADNSRWGLLIIVCMYVCMGVCMYVCTGVCMYTNVFIGKGVCNTTCVYVCMFVCIYVCMYACMFLICIYVCMCVVCLYYVCMYIYMYVCMYL